MSHQNPTKIAVIGAGHLGKIHTKLAAGLDHAELIGVVEPHDAARAAVAEQSGVPVFAHHHDVIDQIDAAIVAAPTKYHHSVVSDLIAAGKHVLVEKPITTTVEQADELVDAAQRAGVVLAVGHVERFNPALANAAPHIGQPKFIEAARCSGYTFRSTDVSVVLDLMIHDIDVILSLVGSPVKQVQALGVNVFGPHEDIAQVRLTFAGGCVANITASRASFAPARSMQVYSDHGFAGIDFATRTAKVISPSPRLLYRAVDVHSFAEADKQHLREELFNDEHLLPLTEIAPEECNPLQNEQQDFVDSIREDRQPRVTGAAGRDALAVAQKIIASISTHQWDGHAEGRVGPNALPVAPVVSMPATKPQQDDHDYRKAG